MCGRGSFVAMVTHPSSIGFPDGDGGAGTDDGSGLGMSPAKRVW